MESRAPKKNHLGRGAGPAWKINLPTALTFLRIALIPPLLICLYANSFVARVVALICFIVASATDFVDGRLARKRGEVTELGKFLDPLADKMLVNLTFLALSVIGVVPVWMFGIILVRDFAVDGVRMMAASNKITIAASKYGKLKTLIQMITVSLIILNLIFNNYILYIVNLCLMTLVVILTVFSGLDYIIKGRKLMV